MSDPQPTPAHLTFKRLLDLLVECRVIDESAASDPEGYDDGETIERIKLLHEKLLGGPR